AQFLIPAAVSLGYGILFATVITLILIPALLAVQHDVIDLLAALRQRLGWQSDDKDAAPATGDKPC
ncbi:hypothetical protein, partial [Gilvimarinus sp. 1_MG-2023]